MAEILTTIAVGIGVVGLVWCMVEDLRREFVGKIDAMHGALGGKIDNWRRSLGGKTDVVRVDLDGKIDGVRVELSNVKADLGELKGKIDLIAQGLHIEISGRSRT